MTDHLLERASQLVNLKRYPEAEQYLKDVLTAEPKNIHALILMALCKSELKQHGEALANIKAALAQEPTNPEVLHIYANILLKNDAYAEAEQYINSAILFDPQNADYFGLLANIKLQKKEWEAALANANNGLAIDPEHIACLNVRSTALFKLDRKQEAYETIRESLQNDPENDYTHTNIGWGLLEKGDHKKALEHFREALKINPENSSAKAGLVQGLKARYLFYRIFVKYAFWIGNMKGGLQWGIIIGFYLGARVLRYIAATNESFAPFINPIIFLYTLFAISTWVIGPLSNLFLRLNVYGRYALSPEQTRSSNFVGVALLTGIIGFMLLIIIDDPIFFMIGIFGLTMMIPLSSMFSPPKESNKRILIGYTIGLVVVAVLEMLQYLTTAEMSVLASVYLIGVFVYGWIANAMIIR